MTTLPSSLEHQLKTICRTVHVVSHDDFDITDEIVGEEKLHSEGVESLEGRLTLFIYRRFYANLPAGNLIADQSDIASLVNGDDELIAALIDSNRGTGFKEPEWRVIAALGNSMYAVSKRGITLHAKEHEDFEPVEHSTRVGHLVSIRFPKHSWYRNSGYYFVYGNQYAEMPPSICVRLYFNLALSGCLELVNLLTSELNSVGIPFQFKVVSDPRYFARYDSVVLYLNRCDYRAAKEIVLRLWQVLGDHFSEPVPLMTKFIKPGLSVAEEPYPSINRRDSFGLNRCRLLARSLIRAFESGLCTPSAKLHTIVDVFDEEGLDITRPYLNPGAVDIY